jgi:hypothetical protein
MENNQLQKSQAQETSLTPSVRAVRIADKLLQLGMLSDYPMNEAFGEKMVEWAMDLDRLMTYEDLEKLPFILDCFKTNELNYDHNRGIRNIFDALPRVEKTETGFRVLKSIW